VTGPGRRPLALAAALLLVAGCAAPATVPDDPPAPSAAAHGEGITAAASATSPIPVAATRPPVAPPSDPIGPGDGAVARPVPTRPPLLLAPDPATAAAESGPRPLPRCRYADQPALGDPATDWATIVLDTIYRLPADYVPERLVSTSRAGMQSGYEVIPEVLDDLEALHQASIRADAEVAVRWAYRSYAEQEGVFAMWSAEAGRERALRISARPGHSEHQLGTGLDFRSADSLTPPWEYEDWGKTDPGAWMRENSWRYGFVLSFPRGLEEETCYDYEPWHFRYVGREIAAAIHASGVSPRRYLWETYAAVAGPGGR